MEELTDKEVEELREELLLTEGELVKQLAANEDGSKPVDLGLPIGRLSRMDAMQQQSMAKANREAAERKLAMVRLALAAVESGDYGYCRDCDEPVGYRRLKARPETPFCLVCQGSREGG